jgi:P27 family predicted phage terminase small subunit
MPRRNGPPIQPKRLQALKGENRPSRVPTWEPEPEPGPTPPPAELSDPARDVWLAYGPELERAGLLRPRHVEAFAAWCDAVVNFRRVATELATAPLVVAGAYGSPVTNPLNREFARYAELIRKFGMEFGMTPSAVTMIGRQASNYGKGQNADPGRILTA